MNERTMTKRLRRGRPPERSADDGAKPARTRGRASGRRPDDKIALGAFEPNSAFEKLYAESRLKNPTAKELLCVEAVILHERILHIRAQARAGVLSADEARSLAGVQNKLLDTYRMLRVDDFENEDDPL